MGLSGLFRSLRFPLWLNVGNTVLEFVGLESRSGLIMRDFANRNPPSPTLTSHDALLLSPPPFSREDFLSGIDNGRDRLIRA